MKRILVMILFSLSPFAPAMAGLPTLPKTPAPTVQVSCAQPSDRPVMSVGAALRQQMVFAPVDFQRWLQTSKAISNSLCERPIKQAVRGATYHRFLPSDQVFRVFKPRSLSELQQARPSSNGPAAE